MEFKKITFGNGLRLITVPRPKSPAATVLILVEAGCEYETKKVNGLSHFLEHMMFKGTTNRPQVGQVAEELAALGAQSNAFTSYEYTGYWAKAEYRKLPKILEIVSDLYLNPIFNPEEINKERGVVIEEMHMRRHDDPSSDAWIKFTSILYGNQPAGWHVAGEESVIRRLKREDFIAYRGKHYVPAKTVVIVSGKFSENQVIRDMRRQFGKIKKSSRSPKFKTKDVGQKTPRIKVKFKDTGQSHLVLGVKAFDMFDKRRYALEVLSDVLGGGMSSRLFKKIRDEMGAVYTVASDADLYIDHGYLGVYAGAEHSKASVVVEAALHEFERLKKELVPEKELQKSKDHIIGNMFLGLETSDQLASFYGSQEVLAREILTPEEIVGKIKAVKAEEIMFVAKSIFRNDKLNLSVIGPYKSDAIFKKILKL